ncbi:hypothetical protein [Eleftheria terrae]|uniref:hypothetical protein n=1 Tax=Eleftheria terrae TaxID=1597781 RepID=UPI00263B1011|nr:hypothetical protein [Eleftheria terrae]WKB54879.1 hypothetical protein N7L95_11050 [Eleftheria terrae]
MSSPAVPGAEALLAGTLILMTNYRRCASEQLPETASRIASNLALLSADPLLSPQFRSILRGLRSTWAAEPPAGPERCVPPSSRQPAVGPLQ